MPLILIAKSKKETAAYIEKFIKTHKFIKSKLFRIYPVKNEILISQIREMKKEIKYSSRLPRLFIFYSFDKATLEAQNALLKSLEEAGSTNQFILAAENEYLILPTVRSRSLIIRLKQKSSFKPETENRLSGLLGSVEQALDYRFLSHLSLTELTKEDSEKFFLTLLLHFRNKLVSNPNSVKIIKQIFTYKSLLENNNLNPRLTFDNLLIFINKLFKMKIES